MEISLDTRGAWVTDASVWLLDGHGRYRRSRRAGAPPAGRSGGALAHDRWTEARAIYVIGGPGGEPRLRLVPADRPAGACGVLTGSLLWTSIDVGLDQDCDTWERFGGPADPWFPPSPVPGDRDLWPGELPFTAFGQFGPDALDLRVFDQDQYWVDRNGDPHRLTEMTAEYLENVAAMLEARASEFHLVMVQRQSVQAIGDALMGTVSGDVLAAELGIGTLDDVTPSAWLASTPLHRRLRQLTG
jgi:hypothetical protein